MDASATWRAEEAIAGSLYYPVLVAATFSLPKGKLGRPSGDSSIRESHRLLL